MVKVIQTHNFGPIPLLESAKAIQRGITNRQIYSALCRE